MPNQIWNLKCQNKKNYRNNKQKNLYNQIKKLKKDQQIALIKKIKKR